VTQGGGFAEFFVAPARNLLTLPANVPFDIGGLTSCAVITAVHAYRRARLELGDTVVVLGTGGIGQILIQILRHAGMRVVGLSRSPRSLELAEQVGADLCVGFAATMKTAADCVARAGQIVVIGEEAEYAAVDTIQIAQRELEIIGSRNGSMQDAVDAIQWMAQGIIQPPIMERVPLERINDGLQLVRDGSAHGRVVVTIKD